MNTKITRIIILALFELIGAGPLFSGESNPLSAKPTAAVQSTAMKLQLPEQVPYLNPMRPKQTQYCIGNGVLAVVADPAGGWNDLIGPGYGGRKRQLAETIQLIVDGKPIRINVEMKRARKTGVFYGVGVGGDIRYHLIDHARFGDSWLSRSVLLENISPSAKHSVAVQACLRNATGTLKGTNENASGYRSGNVAVTFTDLATTVSSDGNTITSAVATLEPGGTHHVGIVHFVGDKGDDDILANIRKMDDLALVSESIAAWQSWYDAVPAAYKLDRITDARARDLIEGGLAVIKANQSADGGFMATPTMYPQGYIRDCTMALRGLHQTGHFLESRQWIQWVSCKFARDHKILDYWELSASLQPTKGGGPSRHDFESTSLYVLTARDYYHATSDLPTLRQANDSLQHSIDTQQKFAEEHSYNLLFNGDETEICFAVPAQKTGISNRGEGCYSMTSAALFAGALEFYIEYLGASGSEPSAYVNSLTKKTVDLRRELECVQDAIHSSFWRTDVPNLPGGFHDSFRGIKDQAWPKCPIVNFTLHPIYWGCPYKTVSQRKSDVDAMKSFYDSKTGFIQLFPGVDNGFCGHNLGFLLYDLIEVSDPMADEVYRSLTLGSTHSWLGYWNEAYLADGTPCTDYSKNAPNGLRSLETGVNVSALARYWHLGEARR